MSRGFTLIEMLLSVLMISMIAGISMPVYVSFQTRNELATTTSAVLEGIRRAQHYSVMGMNDSSWGVSMQAGSLILFKGATYASRDAAYDEVVALSSTVTTSGLSEVVFGELTGNPSATGTITLTSSTTDTESLTINTKGVVTY